MNQILYFITTVLVFFTDLRITISGSVKILRQAKEIDFKLLYSGKLCFDELNRIKRIRRVSIKLPHFMQDISLYRYALREICYINGLQPPAIKHHVYKNPITEEKMAKVYGRKRRFSSPKLRGRKYDDVKYEERNVGHLISCEIFAIKSPLKRACSKNKMV